MYSIKILGAVSLVLFGMAGVSQANKAAAGGIETTIVTKSSAYSVSQTLDRLAALVTKKGMTVFARIDHKKNAKAVGKMITDSQVLVFGSADVGTRIMWHDPKAALDLPMRVLAYEDADDKVWVVYRRPMALNNDFTVSQCASIPQLENAMDQLTNEVIKK
jgi:uncharacterized protein (DUF302 family)